MNLYGVVTGTNDYSLNVSFPNSFRLSVGDTITIRPLNANTGASTLNIGFGAMPLTLNGTALANGQLEANKDRQCTFIGSGFALDSAAGGGASFVGTSSNLTLGDGSAGIVPAGNFGNLSAADISAAVQDLQTSASPQFAAIQLGHANDTTLGRSGAGVLTVEGVEVTTNTATQTLTNKTLTAPKLANGGFIADANGNEGLILVTTTSAVNEVTLTPAATGNAPKLAASGADTNINLQLSGKGSGGVAPQGTGGTGQLLFQTSANGVISSRVLAQADIPALAYFSATLAANQTSLSGSYADNTVAFATIGTNERSIVSGLSAGVATIGITGTYLVRMTTSLEYTSGSGDGYPSLYQGSTQLDANYTSGNVVSKTLSVWRRVRLTSGQSVRGSVQAGTATNLRVNQSSSILELWLEKEG